MYTFFNQLMHKRNDTWNIPILCYENKWAQQHFQVITTSTYTYDTDVDFNLSSTIPHYLTQSDAKTPT